LHLRTVMIPIDKVQTAPINSDRSVLLGKLRTSPFTRLLVYDGGPTDFAGYIDIYEVLSSGEDFRDIAAFLKPIKRLDTNTSVIDAIESMRTDNDKIVLVTRTGRGGRAVPIGIVTMKDLVEELLGELSEW
jgi:CBS domain containing-hemolysin-like protein